MRNRMSTGQKQTNIFLGNRIEDLSNLLSDNLLKFNDPFVEAVIMVPNSNLRKWLWLKTARQNRIAANLDFKFLENGIWDLITNNEDIENIRLLSINELRMLILTVLMDKEFMESEIMLPVFNYLYTDKKEKKSGYSGKLWQLSSKLCVYLRDYTYHRNKMIDSWMNNYNSQIKDPMKACQRTLYLKIFGKNGLLQKLNNDKHNLRPLIRSLLEQFKYFKKKHASGLPSVHVFGFSHISPLHSEILLELGKQTDVTFYQLSPFSSQASANKLFSISNTDILTSWAYAGYDMFGVFQKTGLPYKITHIPDDNKRTESNILEKFQSRIMNPDADYKKAPQDCSIQITGSPGIFREVETVYNSIIYNMENDPELQLTDIAVMTTDMKTYRPVIESVFSGSYTGNPGKNGLFLRMPYNLTDSNASDESLFGKALLNILSLSETSFTRKEVFDIILNPCFMSGIKIDRDQAMVWLNWTDKLNIFHHFDRAHSNSSFSDKFTWSTGMKRLRLGRIMAPAEETGYMGNIQSYKDLIPFSDMQSNDDGLIGKFSLVIESLYKTIKSISSSSCNSSEWKKIINGIIEQFLAIPYDREGESLVKKSILESFETLHIFDRLNSDNEANLSLYFIIDFIKENLCGIPVSKGQYLSGGITISSLLPMRPIPFKIVYIMGMGEGKFPGTIDTSSLDIRNSEDKQTGDVSFPETNRYLFLETLLSTRNKLYLSYVSRDIQADQKFYPCSVINQMESYLNLHILSESFAKEETPLNGYSRSYLKHDKTREEAFINKSTMKTDVIINYSIDDRLLLIKELINSGEIKLTEKQNKSYRDRKKVFDFSPSEHEPLNAENTIEKISIRELSSFIENPVYTSIKRHLQLIDDSIEDKSLNEDEPFYSGYPVSYEFPYKILNDFVNESILTSRVPAQETLLMHAENVYKKSLSLKGSVPDGAFGEIDYDKFLKQITDHISPKSKKESEGLITFLKNRLDSGKLKMYGSVEIGETYIRNPVNINPLKFPAVLIDSENTVELTGGLPLLWKNLELNTWETISISPGSGEKDILHTFLFYAVSRINPENDLGKLIGNIPMSVNIFNKTGFKTYTFFIKNHEDAFYYINGLINDFFDSKMFDYLPFRIITSANTRKKDSIHPKNIDEIIPIEKIGAKRLDYKKRLETAIENTEDRLTDIIKITGVKIPDDALDKVKKRLTPIYKDFLIENVKTGEAKNGN